MKVSFAKDSIAKESFLKRFFLKRFLLVAYISLVVGLSLAARAGQALDIELPSQKTPLVVTDGFINDSTASIELIGQYSNICTTKPHYELLFDELNNALVLDVSGIQYGDFCAEMMGAVFHMAIPLEQVKFQIAEAGMDIDSEYTIMTREAGFKAQVSFSTIEETPALTSFLGEVQSGSFVKPTLNGATRPVIVSEPVFF